jgi:predicted O-methyltransferase YrrM
MKLSKRTVLVAVGGTALVALVALIAVIADVIGVAILCVVALQVALVGLLLIIGKRQSGTVGRLAHQETAIRALDRRVTNMAQRSVTESQAAERSISAQIKKSDTLALTRIAELERTLDRRGAEHVQDIEALIQLFGRFAPRAAMPSSGRWAMEPTGLLRLVDLVESSQVRTIVELGSSTSTVWLAYALEKRGAGGLIISIDRDPRRAAQTRAALRAHGFADGIADVRDALLADGVVTGHDTKWYDPKSYADLSDIDVLIVDAPTEENGKGETYAAVPALLDRLAPGAIVVVDNAGREAETLMVERWREQVPALTPMDQSGPGRQLYLTLTAG